MSTTLDDLLAKIEEVGNRVDSRMDGIEGEIGHADNLARLRESAAEQEKLDRWLKEYHRNHRSVLKQG